MFCILFGVESDNLEMLETNGSLTLRMGPMMMMLRGLKLPMTSLGTPLLVSMVPRKLAALPKLCCG